MSEFQQAKTDALRLAAIVEYSDDAIVAKELNSIITSWNQGAERLFGYTAGEMVGSSILRLIPADRQDEENFILGKIRRGESVGHFETVRRTKDGRFINVSVAVSPMKDATGKVIGVLKVARDNTELKQAERAVQRLAAIVEYSDDAIVSKDLNSIVTSWNKGAEKIFGYTSDEMVGTSIMRLIPADRQDEEHLILGKIKRGESVDHFETLRKAKDGRFISVSVTASPIKNAAGESIGVSKVARDITERKRSEQRMALLNTCVSNLNDIVLITEAEPIDEPGPRIVFVNEAFERLTGYTSAETLGRSPRFLQREKTDRRVLKEIRDALALRQPIRRQIINYRKDGAEYWLDMDIVPILNTEGNCTHFAAIERDITDRKLGEGKLQEREEQLRLYAEHSPVAVAMFDRDMKYLVASQRWREEYRLGDQPLIGRSHYDVFSEVPQRWIELHRRCLAGAVEKCDEDPFPRADGTTDWLRWEIRPWRQADGSIGGIIIFSENITDRKLADEQIAEQAALLDKAQDAILVRDLEGKILFWNSGAERMYGWTRQEVVGRNIGGLLYTCPTKFEEVNGLAISQGEWHGELQHVTKERGEITIEARWTLIRDNEGRPKSVLAINTDITEKKKIEAQFMRAQRMESIGTLAGGIAHDLNNILAPIMMSIDILKTLSDNPQAVGILDTIEVSARRGADIVRQVLSFARGLEGQRVEVQPKHLVKDLENIIKDTFPKDIRMKFSVPGDIWTIPGDPTQIHQVLLNLCVNARDAMPNGGNLTVTVENCVLDEQYAAMNLQAKPGRYVNISVTDSGTGIPEGIIGKIFEPFFTTKDLTKGTGLGLSTVMAIVKGHQGIINVYSEPGKGTTFKVYLPALDAISETRQSTAQLVDLPRGNGETVLIVEDEASILTITSQTLQAFGYRVLTAVDGADAIAVYAQHRDEIAVVLTDMMMPIMDGPAMIQALLRMNPAIKIIAASGLNANGGVVRASGVGVHHFLLKPYTAGTLLKTMRSILDEA